MRVGPIGFTAEKLIVEVLLGIIPGAATGASLFLFISRTHWPTVLGPPEGWVVNELCVWTFAGAASGYLSSHILYGCFELAPNARIRDFTVAGVGSHILIGFGIGFAILTEHAERPGGGLPFCGAGLGILIGGLIGYTNWLLIRYSVRVWLRWRSGRRDPPTGSGKVVPKWRQDKIDPKLQTRSDLENRWLD
jgi:hypothetical protein